MKTSFYFTGCPGYQWSGSHTWSVLLAACLFAFSLTAGAEDNAALWDLAKKNAQVHRFSTLFTAHNVRDLLATDDGINSAMDWCRKTAVTKVYIETFRDNYQAERNVLLHAKERFTAGGFIVSGCITTTKVGKSSTGWKNTISCYTDRATQEKLRNIFEYAAGMFDEIMIDDFWFTDCKCSECDAARLAKKVVIGEKSYPVAGDTWEDYQKLLGRTAGGSRGPSG